jgi:ABC-type dipeptide/oligopeptide/nickel transport system permease subunit
MGASSIRLLCKHILPHIAAPIIVQASLSVGTAIIFEASLSFLGVGIQPPTPSWGVMLRSGYQWMETAPWMAFVPGVAIYLIVITMNLLGDRLRIVLDPKQRL